LTGDVVKEGELLDLSLPVIEQLGIVDGNGGLVGEGDQKF